MIFLEEPEEQFWHLGFSVLADKLGSWETWYNNSEGEGMDEMPLFKHVTDIVVLYWATLF